MACTSSNQYIDGPHRVTCNEDGRCIIKYSLVNNIFFNFLMLLIFFSDGHLSVHQFVSITVQL